MDNGQWTVDSGQWTVDSGQWTTDSGQRTVDNEQVDIATAKAVKTARADNRQASPDSVLNDAKAI